MPTYILALNYWLHLIASVIWIGGLALFVLLLRPVLERILGPEQSTETLRQLERRFTPYANVSLTVLIVTGLLQMTADSNYDGLLNLSNVWASAILLKHITIAGMIAIALYTQLGLRPALERARLLASRHINQNNLPTLHIRERRLSILNFAFGLLVLLFTAIATAQ